MDEKEEKMDILTQYDKKGKLYENFLNYFYNTITGILDSESIVLQSVDTRLKKRESLNKKIKLKKKYKNLEDITDICGIRIITFFSDDVDKIARLIREEFEVDEENSVDKRKIDDPTKFGYMSLHYIISLKGSRATLPEAKRFINLKIEIQIRTILQHAWAEIEHDLGYKTVGDIPRNIRRKFSLLAGQIELADENFVIIKKAMEDYSKEVINKMDNNENSISIDIVTVTAFINNDKEYVEKVKSLARNLRAEIIYNISDEDSKKYLSNIVDMCNDLGIKTISHLKEIFIKYSNEVDTIYRETGIVGFPVNSPISEVLSNLSKTNELNMNKKDFIKQGISDFEESIQAKYEEDMESQYLEEFDEENGAFDWDKVN